MANNDITPTLTIFTPTYNRAGLLQRVYGSLCKQDCQDFLWMIIDDGSTDDTEGVVREFLAEGYINIEYYKKKNGGKYTAYNYCLTKLQTELVLITMDSDDHLKSGAINEILRTWEFVKIDSKIQGEVFLCEDLTGKLLLDKYEDIPLASEPSLHQAISSGWFYGEAEYVFRSEYVKRFSYPERSGERFFNEAYTYIQMNEKMHWVKKSIYIREYQNDGLTNNFLSLIIGSPLNYADYANIMARWGRRGLSSLKYTLYYDSFSLFGGTKDFLARAAHPIAAWLLCPLALVVHMALKIKQHEIEISHV